MAEPRKSDGKPNLTQNNACFGCTIACGRISSIDPTHFSIKDKPEYKISSGGLEYEAAIEAIMSSVTAPLTLTPRKTSALR